VVKTTGTSISSRGEQIESGHFRHLNVEKDHIDGSFAKLRERRLGIGRGADDRDSSCLRQQMMQAVDSEVFIVYDERADPMNLGG
jgi:hypothetical protein